MVSWRFARNATLSLVPTPSQLATSTGSRHLRRSRENKLPKPPISASTCGVNVPRASAAMRCLAWSARRMFTPASAYVEAFKWPILTQAVPATWRLPDSTHRRVDHRGVRLASKRLLEFGHVRYGTIHAEAGQRVRIAYQLILFRIRARLAAPFEGRGKKEVLARRETVGFLRVQRFPLFFVQILERKHGDMHASVIGGVFARRQLALLFDAVLGNDLRILILNAFVFFVVAFGVFR